MKEMIKIKFHSIVDVITNSSTVIYTYQNSTTQAKELVAEVLKLMGLSESPDDVFYYGEFCDDDIYFEYTEERFEDDDTPDDYFTVTARYGTDEYKEQTKAQRKWFQDLKLKIMKGEVEKPEWMKKVENYEGDYGDSWAPDSYLNLIPKDDKYAELGVRIRKLLGSVGADGGRDG